MFAVSRFENRNGVTSWRVSGFLHGVRIRKNLKTREEAAAEKAALERKSEQIDAGLLSVMTCLTAEQVRDAEAGFHRLSGQPHSLAFCIDYTLTNYRAPEREKPLNEAVAEYLAFKRQEHGRGIISEVQVGNIKKELALLMSHFSGRTISVLTPESLTAFCERGKPALKTYDNRRSILSTLFKFAFQKAWVVRNPVERIPYYRIAHRRGSAQTSPAMTMIVPALFAVPGTMKFNSAWRRRRCRTSSSAISPEPPGVSRITSSLSPFKESTWSAIGMISE
jgi:hypothetical protein